MKENVYILLGEYRDWADIKNLLSSFNEKEVVYYFEKQYGNFIDLTRTAKICTIDELLLDYSNNGKMMGEEEKKFNLLSGNRIKIKNSCFISGSKYFIGYKDGVIRFYQGIGEEKEIIFSAISSSNTEIRVLNEEISDKNKIIAESKKKEKIRGYLILSVAFLLSYSIITSILLFI